MEPWNGRKGEELYIERERERKGIVFRDETKEKKRK